mgnify:CR=1 FL=1
MEEKKRKGYKTKEGQKRANERYLENNPEAVKKGTARSIKSNAKRYIRECETIKELEQLEILIKNRKKELT